MSTKKVFTQDEILKLLDTCYRRVLDGVGKVGVPVEIMAKDYLDKSQSPSDAAKNMINTQIVKCATSGFIMGFGGAITLPITIPANVGTVLYVQMRMIACTAYLAGYDLESDQVQTLIYACLAGVTVNEILKKAGVKLGEKMAIKLIDKIPGRFLAKINQKVGIRLITKFGEKGIVNIGKLVPGVGALINGGLDLAETKLIGARAYKWFFEGDFSTKDADQGDSLDIVDFEKVIDMEYNEK